MASQDEIWAVIKEVGQVDCNELKQILESRGLVGDNNNLNGKLGKMARFGLLTRELVTIGANKRLYVRFVYDLPNREVTE